MGIDRIRAGGIAAVFALALLAGCGGNDHGAEPPDAVVPPAPLAANPQVRVFVSDASATPLAGVRADVVGGSASATTAADGSGAFELAAATSALVRFSKAGYTDTFKTVSFGPGSLATLVRVSLRPRDAGQPLDASAGGSLSGRDGASVTLPANGLVDAATGAAVSGMVDVAMTPIDVGGDELRAFPGRFVGTDGNGVLQTIATYGTTEFVLTQGGRRLNLAPGQTATIELPIYTPYHSPGVPVVVGDVIPLWSLDESSGVWKQEGTGTVVASAVSTTGLAMRATVGHFSWWNCDAPYPKSKIDLDIKTPDVADKDKVADDRGPTMIDNVETDPNKYHVCIVCPVYIDGRTADDRLLRQAGIDFEAVFKDGGLKADRKHAQAVLYGVATNLLMPADRIVALTACAQVQRADGTRFPPVMACGTITSTFADGAKVTIQLEVGEARDLPYIVVPPKAVSVDPGATAAFAVDAIRGQSNDSAGLSYQWTKNGLAIAGATAASYVTPATTSADDRSFFAVVVSSSAGVTISQPARLFVNAPPPPPPPPANAGTDRWVDATLGNDANPGTVEAPYRTITAAIAVVKSGGTVWLNDGIWTPAIDPGIGPDINVGLNCKGYDNQPLVTGTQIRAINPGRVTIRYASVYGICVGDTQVRGVRLESLTSTAGEQGAIVASVPGNSLLSGVSFDGGSILVYNGAKLTIEAAGLASYGSPGNIGGSVLRVFQAGSEVTVNGGAFDALSPVSFNAVVSGRFCTLASLQADLGGRLVLNRVDLRPGPPRNDTTQYGNAVAGCSGSIEINSSTISGFTAGSGLDKGFAVSVSGGSLALTSSILSGNWMGIHAKDANVVLGGGTSVYNSISDGVYARNLSQTGASSLSVASGSVVAGNGGHGINAENFVGTPGVIDIASAVITGNALAGLRLAKAMRCRVRDSSFTGNVSFGVSTFYLANCDLGTAASPGGNTFANTGPGLDVNVDPNDPTLTVLAVGNQWLANAQGADPQGRYVVAPGQSVLEVTGPVTSGLNYRLGGANARLRLAE